MATSRKKCNNNIPSLVFYKCVSYGRIYNYTKVKQINKRAVLPLKFLLVLFSILAQKNCKSGNYRLKNSLKCCPFNEITM